MVQLDRRLGIPIWSTCDRDDLEWFKCDCCTTSSLNNDLQETSTNLESSKDSSFCTWSALFPAPFPLKKVCDATTSTKLPQRSHTKRRARLTVAGKAKPRPRLNGRPGEPNRMWFSFRKPRLRPRATHPGRHSHQDKSPAPRGEARHTDLVWPVTAGDEAASGC